jgi:hypothetical protein
VTDVFPQSVQGAGTVRVQFVATLATPAAPLLTEINATSSLDSTPYFRAEAFQISMEQPRIDDTRLSDEATREALGLATFSADALRYVHNPQAIAAAAGNKAYDKFTPGLNAYFVLRMGTKALKSAAAFAATQRISVWAVQFGEQHMEVPNGDNAVHLITQPITLTRITPNFTLAT